MNDGQEGHALAVPEYLTETEVAVTLGRSRDWLRRRARTLCARASPIEGLIGLTSRQDVLAWVKRRRRVADVTEAGAQEIAKGDCP